MLNGYFITGTDTGVGKTQIACALLHLLRESGLRAVGYKPVAAGAMQIDGAWRNEDALALHVASTPGLSLDEINPLCLREAIAPHIAAQREGRSIAISALVDHAHALAARSDALVVEGAGGFLVPLDAHKDFGDLATGLQLPVVLVVGLRLGCLNHALLSVDAIAHRGLRLAGWVANTLDPDMPALAENVDTLRARIASPCLGIVPHLPDAVPAQLARHLQRPE